MMRDAAARRDRHLVGADVEAAIDGCRIAADDLAVEALGERDGEGALAGGGRAEDRHEPGPRVHGVRQRAQERQRRQHRQQHHQADLLRAGGTCHWASDGAGGSSCGLVGVSLK